MNNIFYSKEFELTFLSNAKVGCSTVKNSLASGEEGKINYKLVNEKLTAPSNVSAPIFGLTRNPYSRALSGYKNKIGKGKDRNVWNVFCKKYGVDLDSQPTFLEFLKIIANDDKPESIDMHFRPQFYNLHLDDVTPMFIGRLERMDEVSEFLKSFGVELKSETRHATNASSIYKETITKEEELLINKIYEKDFLTFGYKQDLASDYVPAAVFQEQQLSERYKSIMYANKIGLEAGDFITAAKKREKDNIAKAHEFMTIAHLMKPQAELIKQKLQQYSDLL